MPQVARDPHRAFSTRLTIYPLPSSGLESVLCMYEKSKIKASPKPACSKPIRPGGQCMLVPGVGESDPVLAQRTAVGFHLLCTQGHAGRR